MPPSIGPRELCRNNLGILRLLGILELFRIMENNWGIIEHKI